ncbi:MAG: 4Fe-4S binding protein [Nitrospiraceae bacterium]|nr:MAG: 4Fe-4S binding protein [Nitrospiraceae bacterium]
MLARYLTLQNIRRVYAVFFFCLFLLLINITDFRNMKGYEISLFLEIDPLISIATFLTSWTVYKGLVLSLIIVISTLLLGRFFCSWICPLGILNQWVSHLFNKRRPVDDYHVNAYRTVYRLKYYILALLLVLGLFGSLQIGLLDPISFVMRSFILSIFPAVHYWSGGLYLKQPLFYGGILIAIIFLMILFANRFITRFWCRVICPLGALLGVFSAVSILRIRRDVVKCTDCQKCLQFCHGACDPHTSLRISECTVCMNCIESCPEEAIHYGLARKESSVQTPLDINRRRLIETAVAGVILFPIMRSVVNAQTLPQHRAIRPPGSIVETDFLRRCIKCGECMRVCPTNVIQPALLEAGFEGLWTPILLNKIGYCEFNCVLCSQVCPTGAIVPLTIEKKVGKKPYENPVKVGTAFYDRGRCLPWAMNIDCIVCEEVCPTSPKAIWFETVEIQPREGRKRLLKRPLLDPKLCVGCGICENKCPVHDRPAVRVTSVGETRSQTNQMILNP